ncbi:MAG: glycoside hydrolase family 15 protein [Rhodospirillales bacterium]|nr:glycoside hydrolase family 15 protein [Rhodospirillales bacterium]
MALPIEDYALIGDMHTGALVGRNGSIDWLCLPRFDSPACFAALVGNDENGAWSLSPCGEVRASRRRYREHTMVVETEFETADGVVSLLDFMALTDNCGRADVVRIVCGRNGTVPMKTALRFRFDYGRIIPWVRKEDGQLRAVAGPDGLSLRTPVRTHGEDHSTIAEFTVHEGDRVPFVLTWHPSYRSLPSPIEPEMALRQTEAWWHRWADGCSYEGPWRDQMVRSLLTLKALTHLPTGGIVAAPTTSLPEALGGTRNWDYRYCWVRDATFTLLAFVASGYEDEAAAWRDWLLRAVAGEPSRVQVAYGIAGERRIEESQLDWLSGYEGSRPVRVGNAAHTQRQLDIYGEIMDALHAARTHGLSFRPEGWRVQRAMLKFLGQAWAQPDEGIWEVRGPRRHFTHSKMMTWVAFDRAIKDAEHFGWDAPLDDWRQVRKTICNDVLTNGFNRKVGAFTQFYGGTTLDAALLLMPLVGFLPATDQRVAGTVEAIQRHLKSDGFIQRYTADPSVDGLPPGEAAFLPCSFWLVDNLALAGRNDEAEQLFERLLGVCNDVGLLSEEYDPVKKRLVGNFPQAFSHVALINCAHNLTHGRTGPAQRRAGG